VIIKNKNIIEKTFLFLWPALIVITVAIFLITMDKDVVVSYLLGLLTSMLVNSLHYRMMKNELQGTIKPTAAKSVVIYFGKLLAYGLVLYFVITNPDWNVLYAFAGILTYPAVMFIVALIETKRQIKEEDKK